MTDARFPDRWLLDRRIDQLSDRDFRSFVNALVWSVTNMTEGVIEPGDLKLIPHLTEGSIRAFLQSGLWEVMDDRLDCRWRMSDFAATQTSRAEHETLANARRREREKKARQRERRAGD